VGRDADRDRSGDQAAWCDLVARLELPSPVDPANPPWPERENLSQRARTRDDQDAGPGGPARQVQARDESATGKDFNPWGQPDSPADPAPPADSGRSAPTPASRGRIVRPARSLRFFVPADDQAPGARRRMPGAAGLPGPTDLPGMHGFPSARGLAPGWGFWPVTGPAGEVMPPDAADVGAGQADADAGWVEWDEFGDNAEERYVPPQVPPQPKLDPVARGAWTALFGGPGYLFIATTLGWQVPGWAQLAAIVAFITGFVVLVSRLGDGPSRRDGPDQGAVV
jgi:hypothetical protein